MVRRRVSRRVRFVYGRMISRRASRLTNDAEKAIAVKASPMHRSCIGLCPTWTTMMPEILRPERQDKRRANLRVWSEKSILHERRNKSAITAVMKLVKSVPFILENIVGQFQHKTSRHRSYQFLHFHIICFDNTNVNNTNIKSTVRKQFRGKLVVLDLEVFRLSIAWYNWIRTR